MLSNPYDRMSLSSKNAPPLDGLGKPNFGEASLAGEKIEII